MFLPLHIVDLIKNHAGKTVSIIINQNGHIVIKNGIIANITTDGLKMKVSGLYRETIPFVKDDKPYILHIINQINVDLLHAADIPFMSKKIQNPMTKQAIINKLKPLIQKKLYVVFKDGEKLERVRGQFDDLGVKGIMLSSVKVHNDSITIPYDKILLIYDENLNSLV